VLVEVRLSLESMGRLKSSLTPERYLSERVEQYQEWYNKTAVSKDESSLPADECVSRRWRVAWCPY